MARSTAPDKRQKLLETALDVFFKFGYKRVEMKEIAETAGISRPGLYLFFKTKEEIFQEAIRHYAETKLSEISENVGSKKSLEDKLLFIFEIWCVRTFDRSLASPEAKEVSDSSLEFAREALEDGYQKLEAIVAGAFKTHSKTTIKALSPHRIAHLIVSSTRGFKTVARNSGELRKMIQDLLKMVLPG